MISWFKSFFAQDDFEGQPYAWLTNQCGHIMLGVILALLMASAWFELAGEFPVKTHAVPLCALVYVGSEVWRGWSGWDSVEDSIFVAGYGCGGAFLLFTEVSIGQDLLVLSTGNALPLIGVVALHLTFGVVLRSGQKSG
jgi:hypothetical protein